jgi:hypothetical protein
MNKSIKLNFILKFKKTLYINLIYIFFLDSNCKYYIFNQKKYIFIKRTKK